MTVSVVLSDTLNADELVKLRRENDILIEERSAYQQELFEIDRYCVHLAASGRAMAEEVSRLKDYISKIEAMMTASEDERAQLANHILILKNVGLN